jgi:hypothetical protein
MSFRMVRPSIRLFIVIVNLRFCSPLARRQRAAVAASSAWVLDLRSLGRPPSSFCCSPLACSSTSTDPFRASRPWRSTSSRCSSCRVIMTLTRSRAGPLAHLAPAEFCSHPARCTAAGYSVPCSLSPRSSPLPLRTPLIYHRPCKYRRTTNRTSCVASPGRSWTRCDINGAPPLLPPLTHPSLPARCLLRNELVSWLSSGSARRLAARVGIWLFARLAWLQRKRKQLSM